MPPLGIRSPGSDRREYDTVLAAAERLRSDARFVLWTTGSGNRFDELADAVKMCGFDGAFRFTPYQPGAMLRFSLAYPTRTAVARAKARGPDRAR
jgi:hypothetical protein